MSNDGRSTTTRATFHGCVWADAVRYLRTKGIATVHLPSSDMGVIHGRAFLQARAALDHVLSPVTSTSTTSLQKVANGERNPPPDGECINGANYDDDDEQSKRLFIPPDADSAHATGFHRLGGMSRYNAMREGVVFSDGNMIRNKDLDGVLTKITDVSNNNSLSVDQFEESMIAMSESLHGIANKVLTAMEEELELSPGWFHQYLGPFPTSSQWHIKRFANSEDTLLSYENSPSTDINSIDNELLYTSSSLQTNEMEETILLPMHTDPSLISIVLHDSPGTNTVGAMGLQYFDTSTKQWNEVHGHGHNVVTVIVGSVLAHLTDGKWPAVKHRVVAVKEPYHLQIRDGKNNQPAVVRTRQQPRRMAATLFVRPQAKAILHVPLPSPSLVAATGGISSKKAKPDMTFETWVTRVAKNYEKKKKYSSK